MAFKTFEVPKYPPRQWLVEGEAGAGKSTFTTQMRTPILPIDADHRYAEVVGLANGPVLQLSDDPLDMINVDRIARLIQANIAGSGVKTIAVDSLTAIIAPLVITALRDNDQGMNKNKVAAYKEKATAMRLLQDVITGTGCDVAWIYHLYEGRDAKAQAGTRTSISELELSRILRSCNLRLRLTKTNGVYTATVMWARRGRSDVQLQDTSGTWEGMPERIEEAVYGGLSEAEMDQIEHGQPTSFDSPASAITWAMTQERKAGGPVFKDEAHAQNTYKLVKDARCPATASEMWQYWITEVEARQNDATTIDAAARDEVHEAREEVAYVE
jgi:hypothetical protein